MDSSVLASCESIFLIFRSDFYLIASFLAKLGEGEGTLNEVILRGGLEVSSRFQRYDSAT